jgi:hypothetical protein
MKRTKIKITKKIDLGYRGHAEPSVGTVGWIDDQCRSEQIKYGPGLKDPTWTFMKFKSKDLGYGGSDPIKICVPTAYFEVME